MKHSLYVILKVVCLVSNMALIVIMCTLISNMQFAILDANNTPVYIIKPGEIKKQKIDNPDKKPLTIDLNNIPKSDYKVPEIG